MFYPDLNRRKIYSTRENGSNYSYSHYLNEITEDCQSRCVYCDITIDEHGGEGMQLDHFKPKKHFSSLSNTPENLVLACPKCNRLKSDHWPIDINCGLFGFLDPFTPNRCEWYEIDSYGRIHHTNLATAIKIAILNLNRPARIQIRRKRIIEKRINNLDALFDHKINEFYKLISTNKISDTEQSSLMKEIMDIKSKISQLRTS